LRKGKVVIYGNKDRSYIFYNFCHNMASVDTE